MLLRSPPRRRCYGFGRGPLRAPTRGGATRHPPLGNATWKLATHPLRPRPEGRVIPAQGFPSTYSPPQGPRLAGPREVCHRLRQTRGKTRDSYPLSLSPLPPWGCALGHPPSGDLRHGSARARERGPESGRIRRSPLAGIPACPGTRRCPARHVLGTALPARVRAVCRVPDVPVPPVGWGPTLPSGSPPYEARWRRPVRPTQRPPWRSIVAKAARAMCSARRRRLTSLWPAFCRPRGRHRPSWTTSFGGSPANPPVFRTSSSGTRRSIVVA